MRTPTHYTTTLIASLLFHSRSRRHLPQSSFVYQTAKIEARRVSSCARRLRVALSYATQVRIITLAVSTNRNRSPLSRVASCLAHCLPPFSGFPSFLSSHPKRHIHTQFVWTDSLPRVVCLCDFLVSPAGALAKHCTMETPCVERALLTAHDEHGAAPGGAPGLGRHGAIQKEAAAKTISSHCSSSSSDASTLSNGSSSSSVDEVASFQIIWRREEMPVLHVPPYHRPRIGHMPTHSHYHKSAFGGTYWQPLSLVAFLPTTLSTTHPTPS
jgi:hypothetical protein